MTTETKHTPGPWTAEPEYEGEIAHLVHHNGRSICSTQMGYGAEEDEANARLIAAAPDALEFALFYDAYMADQFPSGLQYACDMGVLHPKAAEAWGRCKAFIAKATAVSSEQH